MVLMVKSLYLLGLMIQDLLRYQVYENIKLDPDEVILGKNDALILAYLDESISWVQIASKIV